MFRAYGLYSHIRANRLKSVLLLLGFVFLLQALIFSFSLLIEALSGGGGDVTEIIGRALQSMAWRWPIGMIAAGLWFAIAWVSHGSMIAFATGAKSLAPSDAPELYSALEELCISRGIATPKLRIIETPALNAFASGLNQAGAPQVGQVSRRFGLWNPKHVDNVTNA